LYSFFINKRIEREREREREREFLVLTEWMGYVKKKVDTPHMENSG